VKQESLLIDEKLKQTLVRLFSYGKRVHITDEDLQMMKALSAKDWRHIIERAIQARIWPKPIYQA
jgi:hypothetical protein